MFFKGPESDDMLLKIGYFCTKPGLMPIKSESSQANSLLKYSEITQRFQVLLAICGMLLPRPAFLRFSGRFSDSVGGVDAVVGVGVAAF